MTFPKQRITIALAEYLLLKPGLDVLANGLAGAKLESFPHRHPFDRIDFVASDVYRNKAYDDQMAARVVTRGDEAGAAAPCILAELAAVTHFERNGKEVCPPRKRIPIKTGGAHGRWIPINSNRARCDFAQSETDLHSLAIAIDRTRCREEDSSVQHRNSELDR